MRSRPTSLLRAGTSCWPTSTSSWRIARQPPLAAQFGAGRAIGVALDVTDEASVAACFDALVAPLRWLDVAGVERRHPSRRRASATQPVAEFDAVTRSQLPRLLLCVRHARRSWPASIAPDPSYWGDIIEINSKSGLTGSSRKQRLRRQQVRRGRPDAVVRPGAGRRRHQGQRHLPRQLPRRAALG